MHISRIQYDRSSEGRVSPQPGTPWLPALLLALLLTTLGLAMAIPLNPDGRLVPDMAAVAG